MILRPAGGAIPPQGPPPGLLEPEKAAGDNLQTSHYDGPMPTTPRSALVLALACAAFACTDRPLGDTEWGTGSGTGDPGTATLPTTATSATSATSASTSTTGPSPGTTGLPTSTSAASATVSTSGPPPTDIGGGECGDGWCSPEEDCETCPFDCYCSLPQALFQGCPEGWSDSAAIAGVTPFGPFNGTTAFFAWEGIGDSLWSTLTLHIFDAGVDIPAAKQDGPYSSAHFSIRSYTEWSYNENEWIGAGPIFIEVTRDFNGTSYEAFLEIYDRSGSWDVYNPDDPPVLYGDLYVPGDPDGVQGPFAAAFCDAFVSQIIPE